MIIFLIPAPIHPPVRCISFLFVVLCFQRLFHFFLVLLSSIDDGKYCQLIFWNTMITHCLLIFRRSVAICVADAFLSFLGLLSFCIYLHVAKLLHFALVFLSFLLSYCHFLFHAIFYSNQQAYHSILKYEAIGRMESVCLRVNVFRVSLSLRLFVWWAFFGGPRLLKRRCTKEYLLSMRFFSAASFFLCSFLLFEQEGFVSNGGGGRVYGRHFFLFIFNVRFHCLFVWLCARSFGLCFFLA